MSEAGKVSLPSMTPERIEEIEFWYRVAEKGLLIKYVHDLLAALEESQQRKRTALEAHERDFNELHRVERELVEAQHTIARQREALMWYANRNNYVVDIDSQWEPIISALEDEGKRACTALEGNKEGSDKA